MSKRKRQTKKPRLPHQASNVIVKDTETMGRGVFTTKLIPKDTTILVHAIILSSSDKGFDRFTYHYDNHQSAIALGIGTLINHSTDPNCEAILDDDTKTMEFKAIKNIKKGEQLFVDYGYDPLLK